MTHLPVVSSATGMWVTWMMAGMIPSEDSALAAPASLAPAAVLADTRPWPTHSKVMVGICQIDVLLMILIYSYDYNAHCDHMWSQSCHNHVTIYHTESHSTSWRPQLWRYGIALAYHKHIRALRAQASAWRLRKSRSCCSALPKKIEPSHWIIHSQTFWLHC